MVFFSNDCFINGLIYALFLIPVVILGVILFGRTQNKTIIIVGSRHITTDELKKDIKFISGGMNLPSNGQDPITKELIGDVIDYYLIMEYAKERHISVSAKELGDTIKELKKQYSESAFQNALTQGYVDFGEWKERLREQLLYRKVIAKMSEGIVPPSRKEIEEYFEGHQDEFKTLKMLKFRQIVTRSREEARDLLKRLHNGEGMAELAREYSVAPEAENGGEVGWVAQGNLDESMEKVLFSMPKGEVSAVIKSPYGYHIFEVLDVRPKGVKKLSEVSPEIESKLLSQKREAFLKASLKKLRTHFEIKINRDLLKSLEPA